MEDAEIRRELEKRRGSRSNPCTLRINVELQEGERVSVTFYDITYKAYTIECKGRQLPLTLKVDSKAVRTVVYISK
jgi:hypothetical protein